MAFEKTITFREVPELSSPQTALSDWTVKFHRDDPNDFVVNGTKFNFIAGAGYDYAYNYEASGKTWAAITVHFATKMEDSSGIPQGAVYSVNAPLTSGQTYKSDGSRYIEVPTSRYFNASNKTKRTLQARLYATYIGTQSRGGRVSDTEPYGGYEYGEYSSSYPTGWEDDSIDLGVVCTFTLNAPPVINSASINMDTSVIYAGMTSATLSANVSAQYGGDITNITFKIGNQTVSGASTPLTILLQSEGTFTPTITVTDSRGQTTTQNLDAIVVNPCPPPELAFSVGRTTATGIPNDEGTYATIDATITYANRANTLQPPIVKVDGVTTTATWYATRATDGTLSDPIDWTDTDSFTSPKTIYGICGTFGTQTSYQIGITPVDSNASGTEITQTLASAFYTIDFLAGGHGIAFGQPASQDGFECNMPTIFHDTVTMEDAVSVMDANSTLRALFDFIHPVGSYYETSDTSFNPNITWGGTWVLETEGQVHISAGSNYIVSGALTNTSDGGEETHTLTVDEMPSHSHNPANGTAYAFVETNADSTLSRRSAGGSTTSNYITSTQAFYRHTATNSKGGGDAHNNMQPYIVVNRWHRTA